MAAPSGSGPTRGDIAPFRQLQLRLGMRKAGLAAPPRLSGWAQNQPLTLDQTDFFSGAGAAAGAAAARASTVAFISAAI